MSASIVIGFGVALLVGWLALAAIMFAVRPPGQSLSEVARLFPEALRLAAALYRDRTLPSSMRWRLRIAFICIRQDWTLACRECEL